MLWQSMVTSLDGIKKASAAVHVAAATAHALQLIYLKVGVFFKRFVSQAPYLKQQYTKAPHITGSGILLEVGCLNTI